MKDGTQNKKIQGELCQEHLLTCIDNKCDATKGLR